MRRIQRSDLMDMFLGYPDGRKPEERVKASLPSSAGI
jgi:hypothetical protein